MKSFINCFRSNRHEESPCHSHSTLHWSQFYHILHGIIIICSHIWLSYYNMRSSIARTQFSSLLHFLEQCLTHSTAQWKLLSEFQNGRMDEWMNDWPWGLHITIFEVLKSETGSNAFCFHFVHTFNTFLEHCYVLATVLGIDVTQYKRFKRSLS